MASIGLRKAEFIPFPGRRQGKGINSVLLALALAVVLSSEPLAASTIDPFASFQVRMGPMLYNAANWGGYAVEANPLASDTVTAVSGTWVVPAVSRPANPAASKAPQEPQCAAWVGIDGFSLDNSNQTVEQVGTDSYIFDGQALYYAWYEMYPGGFHEIGNSSGLGAISPGDTVTASVQYNLPSYPNEFLLTITDNTTGKTFSTPQSFTGTGSLAVSPSTSTAEWIVEAPQGAGGVQALPLFGSVSFSNCSATIGGTTGPIDDPAFQEYQVDMNNSNWNDAMTPTAVSDSSATQATSSFTVVQVPEPSTLALLAAAAAMLAFRKWKT